MVKALSRHTRPDSRGGCRYTSELFSGRLYLYFSPSVFEFRAIRFRSLTVLHELRIIFFRFLTFADLLRGLCAAI